jgi:hypothetical protein
VGAMLAGWGATAVVHAARFSARPFHSVVHSPAHNSWVWRV